MAKTTVSQTLRCQLCNRAIADASRLYCSPACKQASYRLRKGQGSAYYRNAPDTPLCARESCHNPAAQGKRGHKMYCSPACKQKAVRERLALATRRQFGPAVEDVSETLPTELLLWRKGRGVVHMGVSRIVTFCGRDTVAMASLDAPGDAKVCQRCKSTVDTKTWWRD